MERPLSSPALLLAATFLLGCRGEEPAPTPPEPPPVAPATPAHGHAAGGWSYSGATGPDHWGDLEPDYAACGAGTRQSPIDLPGVNAAGAPPGPLGFDYKPMALHVLNNGHTVQAANEDEGIGLQAGSHGWLLAQGHLHAPSEHTVEGRSFPLELHLVHEDNDGKLAVVGLLFEEGEPNAALAPLFANMPAEAGKTPVSVPDATIDLAALVGGDGGYYHYAGSLTTPPCSEGVDWFVLTAPRQASAEQVAALRDRLGGPNNRPVQAFNDRGVDIFVP